MQITLYDSEMSLPGSLGEHILICTGLDSVQQDRKNQAITTETWCTYVVGDKTVTFKKNTESVHLRFEDAVLWAVRYARNFNIPQIHAVFKLERPLDPRFLRAIGTVPFNDKRKFTKPRDISRIPQPRVRPLQRPPLPKSSLQRFPILRRKTHRYHSIHRNGMIGSLR